MDSHGKITSVPACLGVGEHNLKSYRADTLHQLSPNQILSPLLCAISGPFLSRPPNSLSILSSHCLCPEGVNLIKIKLLSGLGAGDTAMGGLDHGILFYNCLLDILFVSEQIQLLINFCSCHQRNASIAVFLHCIFIASFQA